MSNLRAEPLNFTLVLLTWSPPQGPNGVIIAYEVTYTVNSSEPSEMNTTDVTTVLTLTLAFSTEVSNISVRAYTSVGPGDALVNLNVSTPENPTPREFIHTFLFWRNVLMIILCYSNGDEC